MNTLYNTLDANALDKFSENKSNCSEITPLTWYEFGFSIIPINPETKSTAVRWQPWLKTLNKDKVKNYWIKHPDYGVGVIADSRLLIVDADSEKSIEALYQIEKAHNLTPNLVISTRHGEHHYFKRKSGTFARMDSFSSEKEPEKLDIRTGRSETEGRSMAVLPPSSGKTVKVMDAKSADDLMEVGQAFIDAIFIHNGREAPRERHVQLNPSGYDGKDRSYAEIAEILDYIPATVGYSDWLKVCFGLHDEFSGSDAGLALFDEWSRRDEEKYPGSDEIEYKWRSCNANKYGGVTFATIAGIARDNYGADVTEISKRHNNQVIPYQDLLEAVKQLDEDYDTETVEKIVAAATLLSALEKDKVLKTLQNKTGLTKKALNEVVKESYETGQLKLMRSVINEIDADNVIHANGQVWLWNESGVWKKSEDRTVRQLIQKTISKRTEKVSKSLVDSITDLFKSETHKPFHCFDIGNNDVVNCLNGQATLVNKTWVLLPHCRKEYRTTQIPVIYDSNARAPLFEQFLNDIFSGDDDAEDKKQVILQMMGYSLMAHCRHEKFIMLIGGGANGKSVLLKVLEGLCGIKNRSGIQPNAFGDGHQRAHLHEKLVNIVTEIKQGEVIDDAALKSIVSGEPATVSFKFKGHFESRPFATCWFGTNHLPYTRDFSDALFRRAIIVPFNNSFTPESGNCDPLLSEKLLAELPGILNMTLGSYLSVSDNGFTMPASCVRELKEWRLESDQSRLFVEECFAIDGNGHTSSEDIYEAYGHWAYYNGVSHRLKRRTLTNAIKKMGFTLGKRDDVRGVFGLSLDENRESKPNYGHVFE